MNIVQDLKPEALNFFTVISDEISSKNEFVNYWIKLT